MSNVEEAIRGLRAEVRIAEMNGLTGVAARLNGILNLLTEDGE
jgi:hypothetical protein